MHEKYLQELGLSDKEAAIYLALLTVDSSSIVDLAEKTKIKRPTVYVILGSLSKKGLVSETAVGKKILYQAEPPEHLETYIDRQKTLLNEKSKRLRDIIPELKAIQKDDGSRPVVRFYEGKEGTVAMQEEFYKMNPVSHKDTVEYLIYSRDYVETMFTDEEREKFKKMRLSHEIKTKVLYTSSNRVLGSDAMAERIKLEDDKYPISCDIGVYNDEVRIISGNDYSSIFIKSKSLADTLRSLVNKVFDLELKR